MNLALGRADVFPELRTDVGGIKTGIDGIWLISEVTHSLDKGGGFSTTLKMETVS